MLVGVIKLPRIFLKMFGELVSSLNRPGSSDRNSFEEPEEQGLSAGTDLDRMTSQVVAYPAAELDGGVSSASEDDNGGSTRRFISVAE